MIYEPPAQFEKALDDHELCQGIHHHHCGFGSLKVVPNGFWERGKFGIIYQRSFGFTPAGSMVSPDGIPDPPIRRSQFAREIYAI